MKKAFKIVAITVGVLALLYVSIPIYLTVSSFNKIRELGNLTKTLDLSDRDPSLQIRDFVLQTDLIPGCRENFTEKACRWPVAVFIGNEVPRGQNSIANEYTYLANHFVNVWSSSITSSPKWRHCEGEKLAGFTAWVEQQHSETKGSTGIFVEYPEEFATCRTYLTPDGVMERVFWLWVDGNAAGHVTCNKFGTVVNPLCTSLLYLNQGETQFVVGFVPAVNIKQYIQNLSRIYLEFETRHAEELQDINPNRYFETPFEIALEALPTVNLIEAENK